MKIKYVILFWVSLNLMDSLFAIDGNLFWDSFYFAKEYVFSILILFKIREYVIGKQEKALCVVGMSFFIIKFITEIGNILGVVDLTGSAHTLIYTTFLLITLATFGYDRKA